MGDIAEYYLTPWEDDLTWTTREGQRIPISEIEDRHLLNILRMLKRNAPKNLARAQQFYLTCPEPNGELAQLAFEQEQNRIWDMDPIEYMLSVPIIHLLAFEAAERGLISYEGLDEGLD